MEINLPEHCQIVDNCTFGSIYSENLMKRGREFFTYLHLPLARSDYDYQFVVNKTKKSDDKVILFPDNQNIYVWILQETILQSNRAYNNKYERIHSPVRLRYLNKMENIRFPRKEQYIQ